MSKNSAQLILGCIMLVIFCWMLCGCAMFQKKGVIKSGGATVAAVESAGKPATLATTDGKESIAIPKDTTVTITEHEATPTAPAFKVTELHFNSPTEWQKFTATVAANTGTVDTSVATKRLEIAERQWLLWAAIGCGIGGIVLKSMLPAWPGLSNGLLLAAVVAGVSWKVAALPGWLWAAGAVIMALMAWSYKRAEWDKNGDGVPDILQAKTVTQPPVT